MMQQQIANVEQAKSWDGDDGEHWTLEEEHYADAPSRYDPYFFEAAAIQRADRVLDVGCGCGKSTRDAARIATAGSALGVDLSSRMLERARERASDEGLSNVRFEQADAQVYPFEAGSFDVAISRFGAMFFNDPVAAFANIARALKAGGRLALVAWQDRTDNAWISSIVGAVALGRELPLEPPGAPGPFALADTARVRSILEEAGFEGFEARGRREKMWLGHDTADALRFFTGSGLVRSLSAPLDDAGKAQVRANLQSLFAAHETPDGVLMDSAAWVIIARKR